MSNKQNSDSAQTGPGLKPPSVPRQESAPNANPATNNPSGSSQGSDRGKDGKST
jgi:hypothetical protein